MPLAVEQAPCPWPPMPSNRPGGCSVRPESRSAWGTIEAAEKKLAQAEAFDVKWGLFDDTPAKVRNDLNKEKPKTVAVATTRTSTTVPGDHKTAKAKLREARAALSAHQYEQAEAIAQEIKGWNLSYSLFEDNPDKVSAAARALRKRDRIRNTAPREQASQGVYDALVLESRELIKLGKLDDAEAKARQAQRMNVVPPLTADRAESVLHDIQMARAGATTAAASPAKLAGAEAASVVAEREANMLLAKGEQAKAQAKFNEAESLRTTEAGGVAVAQAATAPAVDPSIQKISAGEPGRASHALGTRCRCAAGWPDRLPRPAGPRAGAYHRAQGRCASRDRARGQQLHPARGRSGCAGGKRGQQLLAEARALYSSGNYPAARQTGRGNQDRQARRRRPG